MIVPTWIATVAADPTFVLSSELNWWDFIAPGIAAVSAGVIAWQAWLTRKSINESKRAVEIAQQTLTENQIARIESTVPRIWATAGTYFGFEATEYRDNNRVPVADFEVFRLPLDAARKLTTTYDFHVHNDGPGTVQLKPTQPLLLDGGDNQYYGTILLQPGEYKKFACRITKTVEEWVADARDPEVDRAAIHALKLVYTGPKDADVDEVHVIKSYGKLLAEDEEQHGTWKLAIDWSNPMRTEVAPADRTYWRSRKDGKRFEV